ncbi:hypothetical protein HNR76_003038 [Pseudoxanthomonas broegbernensis]|nr:hypothetical protein [Pseudoxanthomonas broegbernensis]
MSRSIHLMVFTLCVTLSAAAAWAGEDISKVNGSIQAEAGRPYGSLETVNGAIRIADAARAGAASTVNGSIDLGRSAQAERLETVNGAIRIARDAQVAKGVETVNGGVFVDRGGTVGGDVETVNGAIGLVGTRVGGGVRTVNGDVTIGVGSHVRGGILIERSSSWFQAMPRRRTRVVIGPDAVVEGPLVFRREVDLHVHRSARIGPVSGAEAMLYDSDTAPRN